MMGRGKTFGSGIAKKVMSRRSKAELQFPMVRIARFFKVENLQYDPIKSESQIDIIIVSKLFPILGDVLEPAMQGCDMIGRVRTGIGKSLGFDIPIMDKIILFIEKHGRERNPLAIILAPTRELALQGEKEFYEFALNLNTLCIYGGMPISQQMDALKQGVDLVVGPPGRVIDLIKSSSLNLSEEKNSLWGPRRRFNILVAADDDQIAKTLVEDNNHYDEKSSIMFMDADNSASSVSIFHLFGFNMVLEYTTRINATEMLLDIASQGKTRSYALCSWETCLKDN
ncbi:DEAD-box ATP-dependent RNA helicase 53-like [Olea europaea subsp. europaea]|uniref:DEAD-box ATP-dependent RNA helicase 53-like n=1 Tax=Olea europaea subsp. europaea TaxID=158383 RepID=A0A8S0QRZ3_OLEEU|nr:DEAD-box ATP-dependent RNA helicase 53-like [Olea europaea subsp. europaea]